MLRKYLLGASALIMYMINCSNAQDIVKFKSNPNLAYSCKIDKVDNDAWTISCSPPVGSEFNDFSFKGSLDSIYSYQINQGEVIYPSRKIHQNTKAAFDSTLWESIAKSLVPVEVPKEQVVGNFFYTSGVLQTEGSIEIIYALNPQINDSATLLSNYRLKQPTVTKMNDSMSRSVKEQFKLDKKKYKNEPVFKGLIDLPHQEDYGSNVEGSSQDYASAVAANCFLDNVNEWPEIKSRYADIPPHDAVEPETINTKVRGFAFIALDSNLKSIDGKYYVSCFPPALISEPDLYVTTFTMASQGCISLPKGRFDIIVIDGKTGQKVKINPLDATVDTGADFKHIRPIAAGPTQIWVRIIQ